MLNATTSPRHKLLAAIKTPSQLGFWFNNLALQYRIPNNVLAVLGSHSGQPDALCRLAVILCFLCLVHVQHNFMSFVVFHLQLVKRFFYAVRAAIELVWSIDSGRRTVYHNICGELVATDVTDEVYADTAWSLVVKITTEA